ncbi:MAG: acyl-CoA thioesterase [Planctomycetota bacterium]
MNAPLPSPFARASAVERLEPGRYRIQVEPAWFQGPGAFGGLTAAWLLRALSGEVESSLRGSAARAPRELSGAFCAPVKEGEAELRARVVRAGLRVSYVTGELLQRGKVAATASAVFAAERAAAVEGFAELAMPSAPPPAEVPCWEVPGLPAFVAAFELRQCLGAAPISGRPDVESGGWVRLRQPEPVDAALAAALLDCYPPALFTRLERALPAATVAWSVHFLCPLPRPETPRDAYHLLRVRTQVGTGGYSSEDDELWAPDGTLVARARQLVAAV